MRELFMNLFEMSHFDSGIKITPFSGAHIVYLLLIVGGIVGGWFWLRKKAPECQERVLRFLAYALAVSYVSDFFVHEFVYGDIVANKLPFHICTVLCPLVCYTQFNRNGSRILEPVAMLSCLAPAMYLGFPASVGEGEPWCYQAVQTMFYHGVLLAWGVLNVTLGKTKPQFRNCWKCAVMLVGVTLWATLGNSLYENQNWFFLDEDAFYIGLVANGIIPKWSLMVINPAVFFLAVLALYGICYAVRSHKKTKAL